MWRGKSMILRIAACDDNKDEISSLLNLIKEIMKEYSIYYHIWEFTSGEGHEHYE